jgi:hypothetical protein
MHYYLLNKSETLGVQTSVPLVAPFNKHLVAGPSPNEVQAVESCLNLWHEGLARNHKPTYRKLVITLSLPMDTPITLTQLKLGKNGEFQETGEKVIDATTKVWRIQRFAAVLAMFASIDRYMELNDEETIREQQGHISQPPVFLAAMMT